MVKFSLKSNFSFVVLKLAIQSQKPALRGRAFARNDVGIRNFAPPRSHSSITVSNVLIKPVYDALILIIGFSIWKNPPNPDIKWPFIAIISRNSPPVWW